MKHEVNMDVEVADFVERLEDVISDATEDLLESFASRHMSDFMSANGATEETSKAFSDLEGELLKRSLRVIRTRWERNGQ